MAFTFSAEWVAKSARGRVAISRAIERCGEDRQDYSTAGSATGLEAGRSEGASVSFAVPSLNEILGSIGQRE